MIKKKFIAILMSALVVASTPVFAAYTYSPINGTNETFDTQIIGEVNAPLPNVTIAYSATFVSGPTGGVSGTSGTNPTITSSSVTAGSEAVIPSDGSYEATATVNLNELTFSKPGEYVWEIAVNTTGSSYSVPGFTMTDATTKKYLHVFIEDNQTEDSQTHKTGLVQTSAFLSTSGTDNTGKNTSFAAAYGTKTLTVNTRVTGNMGNKTQPFDYTVTLTGCNAGSVIDGETVPQNGTLVITKHANLTHGDSFSIAGIPDGAGYTVSQNGVEGYTTSVQTQTGTQTQP